MDSVTQIALGSALGLSLIGPNAGARRSVAIGAVLGTLPDLDVFWPYADPVQSFTLHRSVTHSLLMQAVAAPFFVMALRPILRDVTPLRCLSFVLAVLFTHSLLDAATIYGTQLLWPLSHHPYGTGSVFIIDPFYTLPLLAVTVAGLFRRRLGTMLHRASLVALLVSTAYLGWGIWAQSIAHARAARHLERASLAPDGILATPMPFSTLLWRVIVIDGSDYLNFYLPVLGGEESGTVYRHRRLALSDACLEEIDAFRTLRDFTKGFYSIGLAGNAVRMADIRMGVTPDYVFDFIIGERTTDGILAVVPEQIESGRARESDLSWLLAGMAGLTEARPAERASLVADLSAGGLSKRAADATTETDRMPCAR